MNQNNLNQENHEDEPRIFGVFIDDQNQKRFNRREFLKSAALVGSTISLSGCMPSESTEEVKIELNSDTPSPTTTSSEIPTTTELPSPKGEVIYSHTMFSGPHVDHPIITKTVLGEEVTIIGRTPDGIWFQIIDSEGNTGWVFSEFIKALNDVVIPDNMDFPTRVPAPCTCDFNEELPPCACDSFNNGNGACECDEVCTCDSVHYWYPT